MQRALVVYESMYGNTQQVATAIAEGMAARFAVEVVEVGAAPTTVGPDLALLVLGGPTHARGLSTARSRQDAAKNREAGALSPGPGLREWLERARPGDRDVAAFDTRIKGPRLLWGSAAQAIEKRLRPLGCRMVAPPQSFLVRGPFGPVEGALLPGELERARAWGAGLRSSEPRDTFDADRP